MKCHSFSTAPQQMRGPRKVVQKWDTNQEFGPSVQNCHLTVGVLRARFTHAPEWEVGPHHTSRSRRQERSQLPASQSSPGASALLGPLSCPMRKDTPSDCLPRVFKLAKPRAGVGRAVGREEEWRVQVLLPGFASRLSHTLAHLG